MTTEKEYLTAISICAGIITLIDYNGNLCQYRQRGIGRFNHEQRMNLISLGLLQRGWERYEEIPKHIVLSYEDSTLLGKASSKYPTAVKIIKAFKTAQE